MERIKIDLLPNGVMPNVYASQYDIGRRMRFILTYGGESYVLSGAEDISVILRKPDKTEQTIPLSNTSSDYVDWITSDDEIDLAGIYLAEIRIEESSVVLGSENFILKAEEDPFGGQITTLTATGNPCTFDTDLADALVSLTANIVCGGGNGTPSSPIPIVGHSELNLIRCGVNLWDEQWETGGFDADGTTNSRNDVFRTKNYIQVPPNTVLHIHQGNLSDSDWCYPVFYDINKTPITRGVGYGTITMPANAYYLRVQFNTAMGNTYADNISINYPATDTEYHAYNGQTFTVAFGQTVYGGEYDKSGRLTITHAYETLDGSNDEVWSNQTGLTNAFSYTNLNIKDNAVISEVADFKCDKVITIAQTDFVNGSDGCSVFNWGNQAVFRIAGVTSVEDMRTWLASNNLGISYELATPIVIDVQAISPSAEIGTNNIVSDCGGDVSVTYIKKV